NLFANNSSCTIGSFTSITGGYNILSGTGCAKLISTDSLVANPNLDALINIRGQWIRTLNSSSAARDFVPGSLCTLTQDQLGNLRPNTTKCDAGAIEYGYLFAPENLTAVQIDADNIELNWDDVSYEETTQYVELSKDAGQTWTYLD